MKLHKKYRLLILTVLIYLFTFNVMMAQGEKLPSFFSNTSVNKQLTTVDQVPFQDFLMLKDKGRVQVNSSVKLSQIGNENTIKLELPNNGVQEVTQHGNQNYYRFTKYLNNSPTSLSVKQYGDLNSLKILGNNSLMNNLTITQTKSATLTIINY